MPRPLSDTLGSLGEELGLCFPDTDIHLSLVSCDSVTVIVSEHLPWAGMSPGDFSLSW